ncbi:MAG: hypothetical protein OXE57_19245 [Alphaproteobacteria bacterium]|nr:hypothetical protein [Alphaproteobacteria bacterium]
MAVGFLLTEGFVDRHGSVYVPTMATPDQGIRSTVFLQPEERTCRREFVSAGLRSCPEFQLRRDRAQGGIDVNGKDTALSELVPVAVFLDPSHSRLNRYRSIGNGPVFHPFGHRVTYHGAPPEARAAKRRMTPTSEDGSTWHNFPSAEVRFGPAADLSFETTEIPVTKEKDASHG